MADDRLTVSEVARLAAISPSTLRLWEDHGLVQPERSKGRHRLYDPSTIERVRDIKRLRDVQGLNLSAIKAALNGGAATPPGNVAGDAVGAGPRLRALRREHGLSLTAAAARAGMTVSQLSAVERTSRGASPASLRRLTALYGTTVAALARSPSGRSRALVRAGKGRVLPMYGAGIHVEQLAEGRLMMDCQRWELDAGAQSDGAYSHDGEEFIHVLDGRFEIVLDGRERHQLGAGDSVYFRSTRPHAWRNPGPGRVVLLWVNTPPTY